jgi:hypothetical protein
MNAALAGLFHRRISEARAGRFPLAGNKKRPPETAASSRRYSPSGADQQGRHQQRYGPQARTKPGGQYGPKPRQAAWWIGVAFFICA